MVPEVIEAGAAGVRLSGAMEGEMTEDEKTACMLLGELGLVDSIGDVSRVVAYLEAEREACAEVCLDLTDRASIRARGRR